MGIDKVYYLDTDKNKKYTAGEEISYEAKKGFTEMTDPDITVFKGYTSKAPAPAPAPAPAKSSGKGYFDSILDYSSSAATLAARQGNVPGFVCAMAPVFDMVRNFNSFACYANRELPKVPPTGLGCGCTEVVHSPSGSNCGCFGAGSNTGSVRVDDGTCSGGCLTESPTALTEKTKKVLEKLGFDTKDVKTEDQGKEALKEYLKALEKQKQDLYFEYETKKALEAKEIEGINIGAKIFKATHRPGTDEALINEAINELDENNIISAFRNYRGTDGLLTDIDADVDDKDILEPIYNRVKTELAAKARTLGLEKAATMFENEVDYEIAHWVTDDEAIRNAVNNMIRKIETAERKKAKEKAEAKEQGIEILTPEQYLDRLQKQITDIKKELGDEPKSESVVGRGFGNLTPYKGIIKQETPTE